MELHFATSSLILLIAGIVLSIITIRRMILGTISIPNWAKTLLILGMLLTQLILLLQILPPIPGDSTFITEHTVSVTPVDPSNTEAAQ